MSIHDEFVCVNYDNASDKPNQKQCDARRKIEDILEEQRLVNWT